MVMLVKAMNLSTGLLASMKNLKKNTGIPQYAPYTKEQEEKFLEFITGNIDLKM